MQVEVEDLLLKRCLALIEKKLAWGSSELWTNHDFEELSERIEKETKVKLSIATLKRIWGKVKYTSRPTITTLDTLVQFIGFENWRVFKLKHSSGYNGHASGHDAAHETGSQDPTTPDHEPAAHSTHSKGKSLLASRSFRFVIAGLALIGTSFFVKPFFQHNGGASDFVLKAKKMVSEGVPNSVIFQYDATAAHDDDKIFIQQSWDERLRTQVDKNEHIHTSIYYYPGYFLAKLIVNDEIVKEQDIYIQTNGWLPLVERPNVPVYFSEDAIYQEGVMGLSVQQLKDNAIPLQPEAPWVEFHNMRPFGKLMSDNFVLETELRNDFSEGSGACQHSEIHIRLRGGLFMIPLSVKGCVSSLRLVDMSGVLADPSRLGVAFDDWVRVKLEVKGGRGVIFVNGEKAYDVEMPALAIAGLLFRFQGTGRVNFVRLSDVNGNTVYEDNF